jgi:hypothetical protein
VEDAVEATSGDTTVGATALEGDHKVGTTVYTWSQIIVATRVNTVAMDENLVADRLPSSREW